MKKILVFALILAIAFSQAGCGSGAIIASDETVYTKLPAVELIMADTTGQGSAGHLFGAFFAQRVLEITEGKLSIEYHPNGELGGDLDLIRQFPSAHVSWSINPDRGVPAGAACILCSGNGRI